MNTTDNNIVLMFLLFLIPAYVIFVCFFNHKFSISSVFSITNFQRDFTPP
jgi:hypothetical protein